MTVELKKDFKKKYTHQQQEAKEYHDNYLCKDNIIEIYVH